MSLINSFIYRFPLLPPMIFMVALSLFIYWVTPAAARSFPIAAMPMLIILLVQYNQYRKGNRRPLERMAYGSMIMVITMLALVALTWMWGVL